MTGPRPGGTVHTLNYHHLLYFYTVVREGSVTRAAAALNLTQPAVSAQLRTLERAVGAPLLVRRGRTLALTDTGRVAFRYAEEIFALGRELQQSLGRGGARPTRFVVGVTDALPKLMTYRLLQPALHADDAMQLVLREGDLERLVADLAVHALDLVLSDAPLPSAVRVRAFSHLLGECGATFLAAPDLARRLRRGFPASLGDAPFLMPSPDAQLRRSLEAWFDGRALRPRVVAEIHDSALLKAFGQVGMGVFAAPSAIEREVVRQYGVRVVGRTEEVRERFYAISVERRIRHPAVLAVAGAARGTLFAG